MSQDGARQIRVMESLAKMRNDLKSCGMASVSLESGKVEDGQALIKVSTHRTIGYAYVNLDWPCYETLAIFASLVQDVLMTELDASGRSSTFPPCPKHGGTHPLFAQFHEDCAWWECRNDGQLIAQIGEL